MCVLMYLLLVPNGLFIDIYLLSSHKKVNTINTPPLHQLHQSLWPAVLQSFIAQLSKGLVEPWEKTSCSVVTGWWHVTEVLNICNTAVWAVYNFWKITLTPSPSLISVTFFKYGWNKHEKADCAFDFWKTGEHFICTLNCKTLKICHWRHLPLQLWMGELAPRGLIVIVCGGPLQSPSCQSLPNPPSVIRHSKRS